MTPDSPFPSQRTAVVPYGWMRRHMGSVATLAPLISGALAWGAGVLQGVDPVKAFQQLGVPVAVIVLLVTALAWTYLVFVPQLQAGWEKTRQLLIEAQAAEITQIVESHAQDRAAWLATQQEQAGLLRELAHESRALAERIGRLERAIGSEPTNPGRPTGGKRA